MPDEKPPPPPPTPPPPPPVELQPGFYRRDPPIKPETRVIDRPPVTKSDE